MKIKPPIQSLALFASILFPVSLKALEVHEWGTFTVLVSSTGQTVNWYQPYSDLAKLPPFVQFNPMMMKSSIPRASVRMETPVIYFYPEKEMAVSARVAFANGQITERFPASTDAPYERIGGLSALQNLTISCSAPIQTSEDLFDKRIMDIAGGAKPAIVRWTGKLLPPDHADAKLIPAANSKNGENYAAARNVPDAWIFHSDSPNIYQPGIPPVEKFIFYRGAGQSAPPCYVTMPDDESVTFTSLNPYFSNFQIALRVRNGQATWIQIPAKPSTPESSSPSITVKFPEQSISLDATEKELGALFITALTKSGLTQDEARAMIATWDHTWFSEPGQRVFTIVNRSWVDAQLPLAITPEPKKTERVFVARYEILSPATEKKLSQILSKQTPQDQAVSQLASLKLGRFSHGAVEIVADQMKSEIVSRGYTLRSQQETQANREK